MNRFQFGFSFCLLTVLLLPAFPVLAQFDSAYKELNIQLEDNAVEIIYPQEERPVNAVKVGEVKVKSSNYMMYCGLAEALAFAQTRAAEKGGNALYVTKLKPPGNKACSSIEADIYKLEEPYVSKRNPKMPGNQHVSTHDDYTLTEIMPEFPGGEQEMFRFLARHIIYPGSAQRDNFTGVVRVSFVVSKTGKITDIKVDEGARYDLDQEAMRVISKMPEFVPGFQNGKPVPVRYNLPITFK